MSETILTEEEWLVSYGIDTSTKGFWLWARALELCKANPRLQQNITKKGGIYDQLSLEFDESITRVERAMRHSFDRKGLKLTPKQVIGDYLLYLRTNKKRHSTFTPKDTNSLYEVIL